MSLSHLGLASLCVNSHTSVSPLRATVTAQGFGSTASFRIHAKVTRQRWGIVGGALPDAATRRRTDRCHKGGSKICEATLVSRFESTQDESARQLTLHAELSKSSVRLVCDRWDSGQGRPCLLCMIN